MNDLKLTTGAQVSDVGDNMTLHTEVCEELKIFNQFESGRSFSKFHKLSNVLLCLLKDTWQSHNLTEA